MKRILFGLLTGMFVFTACQKELTYENTGTPTTGTGGTGGTGGGTGGGSGSGTTFDLLLKAVVKKSATDSAVTEYTYNTSKQVTQIYTKDVSVANGTVINWFKYKRDASGKVLQLVQKYSMPIPIPGAPDSIVIDVFYPAGSTYFKYSKYSVDLMGIIFTDSTVYSYDGSNRVIQSESFQNNPLTGSYQKLAKQEYSYDANGNVKGSKMYNWDDVNNVYDQLLTETNDFDGKTQPVIMGNECFINNSNYHYFSKNNTTKQVVNYLVPTPGHLTSNVTFTYNSANKPATGTIVMTGMQTGTWNGSFYYN